MIACVPKPVFGLFQPKQTMFHTKQPSHRLKASVRSISHAISILCVAAPALAQSQAPVSLSR